MPDIGQTIGSLSPLIFGGLGAITAKPDTVTRTSSPTFLTPGAENIYNQGISLVGQAGSQPYAANDWITNYQKMLAGVATDPTLANVYGNTAETVGGLSNELNNTSGGANWTNDPSRMNTDVMNAMNPYNNAVRDQTLAYAQEAADRGNAADRAGVSANASGFGDRSQIALELARDKRQQGLNFLDASLNQTGYQNALSQANTNNSTARSDINKQVDLANMQPQLGQQIRGVQLDNANLLKTEGSAQRDYPFQVGQQLIAGGSGKLGSTMTQTSPNDPLKAGIESGLAAFSPQVQSGVGSLVNSIPGAISGIGDIFSSLSSLFADGGRAKFARGGLARFEDGGPVKTEVDEEQLKERVLGGWRPTGPTIPYDTSRRPAEYTPRQEVLPPLPSPVSPRNAPTVGGTNIEDEYIRRLMDSNPGDLRKAHDDERASMENLVKQYAPKPTDDRTYWSNIGAGMANSKSRSIGTAFAQGVGGANQIQLQQDQLERQSRKELATIQLSMSRENRKELTDAEKTRLTTLAQLIRERNQTESNRQLREATLDQTRQLAADRLAESRHQHDMMGLMHSQQLDLREAQLVAPLIGQLRRQAAASIDAQLKANGETMPEEERNNLIEQRVTEGLPKLLQTVGIRGRGAAPAAPAPTPTAPAPTASQAAPPAPAPQPNVRPAPPAPAPTSEVEPLPPEVAAEKARQEAAFPTTAPTATTQAQSAPQPVPRPAAQPGTSGLPGATRAPIILSPAEVTKQLVPLTERQRAFETVDESLNGLLELNKIVGNNPQRLSETARVVGRLAGAEWATAADKYDKDLAQLVIALSNTTPSSGRQTDAFRELILQSKPGIKLEQDAREKVLRDLKANVVREREYASVAGEYLRNRKPPPDYEQWLQSTGGSRLDSAPVRWERGPDGKPRKVK